MDLVQVLVPLVSGFAGFALGLLAGDMITTCERIAEANAEFERSKLKREIICDIKAELKQEKRS